MSLRATGERGGGLARHCAGALPESSGSLPNTDVKPDGLSLHGGVRPQFSHCTVVEMMGKDIKRRIFLFATGNPSFKICWRASSHSPPHFRRCTFPSAPIRPVRSILVRSQLQQWSMPIGETSQTYQAQQLGPRCTLHLEGPRHALARPAPRSTAAPARVPVPDSRVRAPLGGCGYGPPCQAAAHARHATRRGASLLRRDTRKASGGCNMGKGLSGTHRQTGWTQFLTRGV